GNLVRLNEIAKLPYIPDLIARKVSGAEKGRLDDADLAFHEREYERLRGELEQAYDQSPLPENARGASAMNDLLVRLRLSRRGDSMELKIPKLSLVVLIGPGGSGKSPFARKHFRHSEVLSSDFCRGLVSDDENDQAATMDAFEVLHYVASKRLARGRLTVIDATN